MAQISLVKIRPRRLRYAAMVGGLAVGLQVPALVALSYLTGRPELVLPVALLLAAPFLATLRNPWDQRPRSNVHLYLVLWPFFAWWTMCVVFTGLLPLALLASALTPLTLKAALLGAGALSIVGALRALSRRPRVSVHRIGVAGLPPEFEGYRIAQLSDLHCGPFTPPARVRRWVDRANALDADLVTVTGDLITSGAEYVPAVAACLGSLRARDGVYGSMGNHDYFTDGEAFARELQRRGLNLLRNRGVTIKRGAGQIYLAGVDDTWTRRDDVHKALRGRPAGAPTVLLAHDPALFAQAAGERVALTLSGHTHGGQFAVPVAPRRWNLARFTSPFTAGIYKIGASTLYVNRGLGTTGPPIRLGVRPEIAVFVLCASGEELGDRLQHFAEDVIREASQ